jgi:hypothetical protein
MESLFNPYLFIMVSVLFIWGLGMVLRVAAGIFYAGFAAFMLAWLVVAAGRIWFLTIAFSEDSTTGMLCMIVPFYSLYYFITNLEETWKPVVTEFVGGVLVMLAMCGGAMFSPEDEKDFGPPAIPQNVDDEADDEIQPDLGIERIRPNKARPGGGPGREQQRRWIGPNGHGGERPMIPRARRWKSPDRFWANSSTARQRRCQSPGDIPAGIGAADAST